MKNEHNVQTVRFSNLPDSTNQLQSNKTMHIYKLLLSLIQLTLPWDNNSLWKKNRILIIVSHSVLTTNTSNILLIPDEVWSQLFISFLCKWMRDCLWGWTKSVCVALKENPVWWLLRSSKPLLNLWFAFLILKCTRIFWNMH